MARRRLSFSYASKGSWSLHWIRAPDVFTILFNYACSHGFGSYYRFMIAVLSRICRQYLKSIVAIIFIQRKSLFIESYLPILFNCKRNPYFFFSFFFSQCHKSSSIDKTKNDHVERPREWKRIIKQCALITRDYGAIRNCGAKMLLFCIFSLFGLLNAMNWKYFYVRYKFEFHSLPISHY